MKKAMAKQHRLGALMIIVGLVSILPDRDLTFALVAVPIGVWMLCSRECIIWHEK